jgi:hypothetical protein
MTTRHLHVLGIIPGDETSWCWLTVTRAAIFGSEVPAVTEWDYGTLDGPEPGQSIAIARKAREIQGLDYRTGPAIIVDQGEDRISAQLELLHYEKRMGDSTIHFQEPNGSYPDEQLKRLQLFQDSHQIRGATRHALTALKRARASREFALELWPYPPSGMDRPEDA